MRIRHWHLILCFFASIAGFGEALAQTKPSKLDSLNNLIKHSTNDTVKFRLFFEAGKYLIDKPGAAAADVNGALFYTERALNIANEADYKTGIGQSYTLYAQIYREKGDTLKAKAWIKKSIELFKNYPPAGPAADAYFEAANYYTIYDNASLRQKIYYYQRGLGFYESTNPPLIKLADAVKFMGDLYQCNYEYARSITYLKRALALYQKAGYKDVQDVYTLMAVVYGELKDTENSLRYNLMAEKLVELKKDSSMTAAEVYFHVGVGYSVVRQFDNALPYLYKAKQIASKNKNSQAELTIYIEIAATYEKMGQPAKAVPILTAASRYPEAKDFTTEINTFSLRAYTDLKLFEKAHAPFNILMAESVQYNLSNSMYEIAYISILNYLLATHQYNTLQKEIRVINKLPDPNDRTWFKLQIETFAFQADSAAGNYLQAIKHLNNAKALSVKLAKNDFDKRIANLQVENDLEKKDQQLAFNRSHIDLLTRQNQMQTTALYDQRLIKDLFIGGAALLTLLLALGYSRYRIKQKANSKLQEQQNEINIQNNSLRQLVSERDWLLKEVHHRIKNNLQIVISLLNSQFYNLEDDTAKEVIRESQHRIHAVSLIHQKLYQYDDLSGIKMQEYIYELALYLQDSFDTYHNIEFLLDIEPVTLDVSQAVLLGLILNETITNVIKHAFRNKETVKPAIRLSLKSTGDKLVLTISDNGAGMPAQFDPLKAKSLGIKLINGLTRQLKGDVQFINDAGLIVQVTVTPTATSTSFRNKDQFTTAELKVS